MNTEDYADVRWDDYSTNAFIPHTASNNPVLTYSSSSNNSFDELDYNGMNQDLYSTADPSTSTSTKYGKTAMLSHNSTNDDNDNDVVENWNYQDHTSYSNNGNTGDHLTPFISPDPTSDYTNNTTTITNTPDASKPMTVLVEDPQKYDANFITYLITTTTTVETFASSNPKPVRRRFQDFVWLYNSLCLEFPACIIPYPPEKHRMRYIKGDRFDKDFIEKRRLGLQWFLNRIARHPLLQASQCTRVFLESGDFKNDKQMQSKRIPSHASVFSVFGDTFSKPFSKVKKPDDRFVMMKEAVGKFEDNLDIVERIYSRIGRRQQDLEQDYREFSNSIRGLSVLEPKVERKLRQFAETMESYAGCISDLTKNEDTTYLNNIHELLTYCRATKDQLQERDQKQVNFEDLSTYLQRLAQDRERLLHPGQHFGGSASLNISDFMADKMGEMKGNNLTQTRRERLTRLQFKLEELEQEVSLANDANNTFSSQMIKEYDVFKKTRTVELKQGLAAYADCHVDFYQKGVDLWTNVLPILESMYVEDDDG
ncbi:hypothetical protein BCR42DRAFT_422091 [Absidia repens]|uniref:Sorting nexin-4 n=1 Tax=Absidia repens TaxID=90262 RepID=A0A1X2I793_9FUNG|nr:hypothetical protein BCR42DRAFT_422091 [Absidia repens]